MHLSDLDYELPEELVAQRPLSERDASRLLVVDVKNETCEHRRFAELPALVPESLFVFNDTRVFPARLVGRKATGGKVELLLLRKTDSGTNRWRAMGRSSKGLRAGMDLRLCDEEISARVVEMGEHGELEVELRSERNVDSVIEEAGRVPLPPYIRREAAETDRDRYQTVYAKKPGAVAAPTAGLHFTKETFRALQRVGHETAYVTLHVGPGTFRPVQAERLDDHRMHEEAYEVSRQTAEAIQYAQSRGHSIVAVGTTVVRTLEASADSQGRISPRVGATRLFIRPPYHARVVDHLVTNFHLPRSTLLALVMALAGVDLTKRAYREAIEARYRFYSYGDAMLIRGIPR